MLETRGHTGTPFYVADAAATVERPPGARPFIPRAPCDVIGAFDRVRVDGHWAVADVSVFAEAPDAEVRDWGDGALALSTMALKMSVDDAWGPPRARQDGVGVPSATDPRSLASMEQPEGAFLEKRLPGISPGAEAAA